MAAINILARTFKGLHQPGKPLLLANVYDILSAEAVAPLPSCKALATASYAVALAAGTQDAELTLETNLQAARDIGRVAAKFQKPLTVDLQDGYGDRLEEAIKGVIDAGAVGVNLEDSDKVSKQMIPVDVAESRIKTALATAQAVGVPDFVVNARCDVLLRGGEIEEAIVRGKKYLDVGATTVFVLGGSSRPVSRAEVTRLVDEFDGRLNVGLRLTPGFLTVPELAEIGVARLSVGPQMQLRAMGYLAKDADTILQAGL